MAASVRTQGLGGQGWGRGAGRAGTGEGVREVRWCLRGYAPGWQEQVLGQEQVEWQPPWSVLEKAPAVAESVCGSSRVTLGPKLPPREGPQTQP